MRSPSGGALLPDTRKITITSSRISKLHCQHAVSNFHQPFLCHFWARKYIPKDGSDDVMIDNHVWSLHFHNASPKQLPSLQHGRKIDYFSRCGDVNSLKIPFQWNAASFLLTSLYFFRTRSKFFYFETICFEFVYLQFTSSGKRRIFFERLKIHLICNRWLWMI